jgi:hypothetical protein
MAGGKATSQVKSIAAVARVEVSADGRGVVSHAGTGMLRELAELTGWSARVTAVLAEYVSGALDVCPWRVFADLAAAVAAGADCIDGVGQRCGDRGACLRSGPVVIEDYLAAMRAADRKTGRSTTQAARSCQANIRRAGGWGCLNRDQQLDAVGKAPSFASWLMVTIDVELLSRTDLRLGVTGRLFCADDDRWFSEICSRLGTSSTDTSVQWSILVKITAITGVAPRVVTDEHFDAARTAMTTAYARRGASGWPARAVSVSPRSGPLWRSGCDRGCRRRTGICR